MFRHGHTTIDSCIAKLRGAAAHPARPFVLSKKDIAFIIKRSKSVIASQPVFLDLAPPIVVCGDLHGQFFDLLRIFNYCGDPSSTSYLFLGDYVDRGQLSVNTICLLLCYKAKYPDSFFLLRGNHEAPSVNRYYGFYDECRRHYRASLWKDFNELFEWFPITAVIGQRILCVHGGISPLLRDLQQLREFQRPLKVPETGLLCDLLWADPGSTASDFGDNERGISCVFGEKPLKAFFEANSLNLLIRAHQVVNAGFDFPYLPSKTALTVFSAPNYCGCCGNSGAVISVSEQMTCKTVTFAPKSSAEAPE